MKYLVSILRIFVLVAVVLSIANFSDIKKAKADSGCTTTPAPALCTINESGFINGGTTPVFHGTGGSTLPIGSTPTVITGNITVVTSGALTFTNLTITNHAIVTQASLVIGADFDAATSALTASGLNKKVDLTVTDTLSLTNRGRIDVSGKGFPGGNAGGGHPVGYGRGGGGLNSNHYSGGAYGGNALQPPPFVAANAYGSADSPTENGSGGSGRHNLGAAGGGAVKIHTNNMVLDYDSQTFISANGGNSLETINSDYYFGGSGGSVWLQVTGTLTTLYDPSYGLPSVNGNKEKSNYIGEDGTISPVGSSEHFSTYIVANGGNYGAAGGRIRIEVARVEPPTTCNITVGDVIPAYCEGKDVTVSGTTINMNKVQVKPNGSGWMGCNEQDVSACDSKRHFKSLTVQSGAVLTHEALTRNDIEAGGKTVNPSSGPGRWKKVDIEIAYPGSITLGTGGKIDVTGKGYPGAYFSRDGINGIGDQGCNGVTMGYLVGANHISGTAWTPVIDYGFGPGGGIAYRQKDNSTGGGGSYAGAGKQGTDETYLPRVYDYNHLSGVLDWGSGGGAGSHYGGDTGGEPDVTCVNGGAGGGIIDLKAESFIVPSSENSIRANGAQGLLIPPDDTDLVGSGGGSGGVVRLAVNSISHNPVFISLEPGEQRYTGVTSAIGRLILGGFTVSETGTPDISVRGGDHSDHNLPDIGAGGGGGWIVLGAGPTPTLSATLLANPSTSNTGSLSTILTATADGTATGTINYTFWWNCTNASNSVTVVTAACGDPTRSVNGAKFPPTNANPQSTSSHIYTTAGSYTAKVIIERSTAAPATATATIIVTGPTIKSKKIEVTVTWRDSPSSLTKTVKLYDVLRSVVAAP